MEKKNNQIKSVGIKLFLFKLKSHVQLLTHTIYGIIRKHLDAVFFTKMKLPGKKNFHIKGY